MGHLCFSAGTLLVVCVGGHKLEGLHKAAAQGDRGGIMHCMKVVMQCSTYNTILHLL